MRFNKLFIFIRCIKTKMLEMWWWNKQEALTAVAVDVGNSDQKI